MAVWRFLIGIIYIYIPSKPEVSKQGSKYKAEIMPTLIYMCVDLSRMGLFGALWLGSPSMGGSGALSGFPKTRNFADILLDYACFKLLIQYLLGVEGT